MNAKEINLKMLEFFKRRKNTDGYENYYQYKTKAGSILSDNDIYLIDEIQKKYDKKTVIHEMAAGAAQLGHALALMGYNVSASEIWIKRYGLAVELGAYLKSPCRVIHNDSFKIKIQADLFVTANAAASTIGMKKYLSIIRERIGNGSEIILNVDLFGAEAKDNRTILRDNNIAFSEMSNRFIFIEAA
jgi:hypothetical protein